MGGHTDQWPTKILRPFLSTHASRGFTFDLSTDYTDYTDSTDSTD
jgi:hypothetical protein